MSRVLISLATVLVLVYVGICVLLYVAQRSLIYYPQPRADTNPATRATLERPDATLILSVRPHAGAKALVYFGGNAEDVSLSLPLFAAAFPQHAIYMMHYRGYGGSTGTPSEAALQADAIALFEQVRRDHAQITIVGRSLGSGIAVKLASQRPAARLILITPYDSLENIAASQFPYVPIKWLLKDKYESWRYAAAIDVPTLLIAAEHDHIIPRANTKNLLRHFRNGIAHLEVVAGADHNSISAFPAFPSLLTRTP
jgi:pimeloyl-ACP methyl ester carboxylesterase